MGMNLSSCISKGNTITKSPILPVLLIEHRTLCYFEEDAEPTADQRQVEDNTNFGRGDCVTSILAF
jgi:hypothetical protein